MRAGSEAARQWLALRDRDVRPAVKAALSTGPVDPVDLAMFLSQYEDDERVPARVKAQFLTRSPLLSMGRTLRDRVLTNWRRGRRPVTLRGFFDVGFDVCGHAGTAALLCHNVAKAFDRGGQAITWDRIKGSNDYTDGRRTFTAKVVHPAGRLTRPDDDGNEVESIFYVLFSADELGRHDTGDWYHYFVTATMAAFGAAGELTGRGSGGSRDSAEDRNPKAALEGIVYPLFVADRVYDLERQMDSGHTGAAHRGWVLANVLSFLEGAHYGETQQEVDRESRSHLGGAVAGLARAGARPSTAWPWYVPTAGSVSREELLTGFDIQRKTAAALDASGSAYRGAATGAEDIPDAGVPLPAGIPEPTVGVELVQPILHPLGGPPLGVKLTIPDLSAIAADEVGLMISDGTVDPVHDEVLSPSLLTSGELVWQWDGRGPRGAFDAGVLTRQLAVMLTFKDRGTPTSTKVTSLITRTAEEWVKARVDRATRTIAVDVYVDCQDGTDGRLGPTGFSRLRSLVLTGIGKYWSRSVTIGADVFAVTTTAHQRANASIDLDLYVERDSDYRRSHNSGLIDASIFYNLGFYKGDTAKADRDFADTAAHEFGHSVLWAVGGKALSWGHKGTVNHSVLRVWSFQDPSPSATRHPPTGEIDLMKYYTDAEPKDVHARSIAAAEDVLRLIGLSTVMFSLP